jgi:hypothetical protein
MSLPTPGRLVKQRLPGHAWATIHRSCYFLTISRKDWKPLRSSLQKILQRLNHLKQYFSHPMQRHCPPVPSPFGSSIKSRYMEHMAMRRDRSSTALDSTIYLGQGLVIQTTATPSRPDPADPRRLSYLHLVLLYHKAEEQIQTTCTAIEAPDQRLSSRHCSY